MPSPNEFRAESDLWSAAKKNRPADVWGPDRQDPDRPKPPGGFTPGSPYLGGPLFTDPFASKRAPSPWQLIEKYRGLIYSMVAKNANAVCRVPLRLYADGSRSQGGKPRSACDPIRVLRSVGQRLARDGKVSPAAVDKVYEIRMHPILSLIDNPDPYGYFSRTKLISLLVRFCDVVGSAYLFPDWDGWETSKKRPNRVPDYLWVLYSQYVLPIRTAGSPLLDFFQYFAQRLPYDSILWFRQNVSLRDPYGGAFSPAYAGTQYSDQEEKQIALYDQVLGMGPRPNMMITNRDPLQPMGEAERRRVEQDAVRRQAGGYAGGLWVVDGALVATPMSYAPVDLGGKEINEYDRTCLASIFGQPPTYYTTDTNLANLEAADQQHARDGVDPRCKMVAEEFTSLIQRYDPRLFFAFDPTLPEDEELKTKIVDMQLKNGSITINQANEEKQWPPVEWGDEPWISGTLVQPSMAIEKHQQELESQKSMMENAKRQTEFQYSDWNSEEPAGDNGNGFADDNESDQEERFLDLRLVSLERSLGL